MSAFPWLAPTLHMVKTFESYRPKPYRCSAGIWSIEWGHVLRDPITGRRLDKADDKALALQLASRLRPEDAETRLIEDIQGRNERIDVGLTVPIADHERAALLSLAYNIGDGALLTSTLLRKLNAGDRVGAAAQFLRWNKETVDGQLVPSNGLSRRRAIEGQVFLGKLAPTSIVW